MSDIKTVWDFVNNRGDWKIVESSLESGSDLETSVLISTFTDRRANADDVIPDGTTNRRGWWGDTDSDGNPDLWGSRLWLLDRRKSPTAQTLNDAVTYEKEALQWMIDDGVAANIDVEAQWNAGNFLAMTVTIYQSNGTKPVSLKFQLLWGDV